MENQPPETLPPRFPDEVRPLSPSEEQKWLSLLHLSGLAGYLIPFGSVVGPLVMWLLRRDMSARVETEGKDALNFHLSMLLYYLVSIPLAFIFVGIFTAIAIAVVEIVFTIIATVKASKGEAYRYPLAIRFVS